MTEALEAAAPGKRASLALSHPFDPSSTSSPIFILPSRLTPSIPPSPLASINLPLLFLLGPLHQRTLPFVINFHYHQYLSTFLFFSFVPSTAHSRIHPSVPRWVTTSARLINKVCENKSAQPCAPNILDARQINCFQFLTLFKPQPSIDFTFSCPSSRSTLGATTRLLIISTLINVANPPDTHGDLIATTYDASFSSGFFLPRPSPTTLARVPLGAVMPSIPRS